MPELIRNGETLRTVRAKINAAINPFPSRAAFEAAIVNAEVSMVYVIEAGDVYRLVRSAGGGWTSGDGAAWEAAIDGGLAAGELSAAISATAADREQTGIDRSAAQSFQTEAGASAAAAAQAASLVWTPAQLLPAGGAFLAPLAPSAGNLWQDTARTTAVTAAGQSVGSARVRTSGADLFAEQATAGNRPVLGRRPMGGVRNLAAQSADVGNNAAWPASTVNSGITVTKLGTGTEDGLPYADFSVTGTASANVAINLYSRSLSRTPAAPGQAWTASARARILTGAPLPADCGVRCEVNGETAPTTIRETVAGAVFAGTTEAQVAITGALANSLTNQVTGHIAARTVSGATVNYTVRIKGFQFELGPDRTAYQANFSALDVREAGQPDAWYLRRSGGAVGLSVTLPDLGANATVGRATQAGTTILTGQTVSGATALFAADPQDLFGLSITAETITDAQTALLDTWLDRLTAPIPAPVAPVSDSLSILTAGRAHIAACRSAERVGLFAQGLFDCLPVPYALWGFQRLRAGYTGPILRARHNVTTVEQDVFADADGRLRIGGVFFGDNAFITYSIVAVYDQTGNGRHLVPGAGLFPNLAAGLDRGDFYNRSLSSTFGYTATGTATFPTNLDGFTVGAAWWQGAAAGGDQALMWMRGDRARLMVLTNGRASLLADPLGADPLQTLTSTFVPSGWSSAVGRVDFANGAMTVVQDGARVDRTIAAGRIAETSAGPIHFCYDNAGGSRLSRPFAAIALYQTALTDDQVTLLGEVIAATVPSVNRGQRLARIGYITDTHVADRDPANNRFYRDGVAKIEAAATTLNALSPAIDVLVHGGDVIDGLSTADDLVRLGQAKAALDQITVSRRAYLVGNHDVNGGSFRNTTKRAFLDALGQTSQQPYGVMFVKGVRIIYLDSGFFADDDASGYDAASGWDYANAFVPPAQRAWLADELGRSSWPTVIFIHHPLDGLGTYRLSNAVAVRDIIVGSGANVLTVIAGHAHTNRAEVYSRLPVYRCQASVESAFPANAFAVLDVYEDRVEVIGYGGQTTRNVVGANV